MSLLLETIKVKNRQLINIAFHNSRMNQTRAALLGAAKRLDLLSIIQIPVDIDHSTYKCRVEYENEIERIEFIPYQQRHIQKLFIIHVTELEYSHKYADRKALNILKTTIPDSENNDILIVKDGFITDTSFANIVFFNGTTWVTPDSPLLRGTKRAFYLENRIIEERTIKPANLNEFTKARIINAMIDLEESPDIYIENIIRFF
jgi:4-amino-4-deoxychorismate lyase